MPEKWVSVKGGKPLLTGDLDDVAAELLDAAGPVRVWLFEGELGAGKTTLIKSIGARLGVTGTMSSPTFSIINEYRTTSGPPLYHFDFYRVKQEQEAFDIGTDEYFDSGNYCFVEWSDRIPSLIPDQQMRIRITPGPDPDTRFIQYTTHD